MKRIVIIFLASLYSFTTISAQKISFRSDVVTNGTTLWKVPVTSTFIFTNKEKAPLQILSVDPGCGCLSATWTEGPVAKGTEGEIKITYDAMLLGRYDKYISIQTNCSSKPVQLRMSGLVSLTEELDLDEMFPYVVDNVRVSANNIEFADVHSGDSAKVVLQVYNAGKEAYSPQLMHLPSYVTMDVKPEKLGRGHRGEITLTVHGDMVPDLGLNQSSIYVARFPGDKVGTGNDITMSVVKLSDQPASSGKLTPKIEVSTTDLVLDTHGAVAKFAGKMGIKSKVLDKVGIKTKLSGVVNISNKGLVPLKLTNVQAFNQAITISVPKSEIAPGETITMKVVVDSRFLGMSKAQPRILLITDDPKRPKVVINVKFD